MATDEMQLGFELNELDYTVMYNPLPKTTEVELMAREGLDGINVMPDKRRPDAERFVFEVEFTYGYGMGKKKLYLKPGESRRLPLEAAKEIQRYIRDKGIVLVDNKSDKTEARLLGLQAAIDTLHRAGTSRYNNQVHAAGYTAEQEKRERHNLRHYLILMEKEQILLEELEKGS